MILSRLEDINKVKFRNKFKTEDALHRTGVIVLSHPFNYCRILMQLGYEPFRPELVDTLFGGSRYAYPSVFRYIKYIRAEDGLFGVFRGLGFRLCSELSREFLYVNCLDVCNQLDKLDDKDTKEKKKDDKDDKEDNDEENEDKKRSAFNLESLERLLKKLCQESFAKTFSLAFTYPLHVCFVRGCSQFIGREKIYDFNVTNLLAVVNQGRFYDGFMPRLLAELIVVWVSSSLIFAVDAAIEPDKLLLSYLTTFINFFTGTTVYPLHLTSTVMTVNHTQVLLASKIEPVFYNWRACYDSLEKRNLHKRGSSLIWRYVANAYKPQAYVRPYLGDDE